MQVLDQTLMAAIPAYICLVAGFILVVVEMYIPGFGVPGISGLILLTIGVIWKASSVTEAVVIVIIIVALLCIALSICIHSASKGRLSKSKLILRSTQNTEEALTDKDLQFFVAHEGTAHTTLRPSGIAVIEGVKLNVVSDGEFIEAGEDIIVDRVEGNRIVVKKKDKE